MVIQYLNNLSDEACAIRAVNTIKIKDNFITGYNTDAFGFKKSYLKYLQYSHKKSFVIGNGGAARAAIYVLKQLKVPYFVVSLKEYFSLKDIYLKKYKVIIQCTPIGTYSTMYQYPMIQYKLINKYYYFYDLIYNPQISKFLKKGAKKVSIIKNGLEMLQIQAELAWYIWNTYY